MKESVMLVWGILLFSESEKDFEVHISNSSFFILIKSKVSLPQKSDSQKDHCGFSAPFIV